MESAPSITDLLAELALPSGSGQAEVCVGPETLTLEEKINQLFTGLRTPIYRYLVEAFGNPAEAEEITQEAFLRLYRAWRRSEEIANPRAWLFRTAPNLALDRLKSGKFTQTLEAAAWQRLAETRADERLNPE